MPNDVTCRGCGIRVALGAHSCYACHCPFPTCHLPEVPERSVATTRWRWAAPAGLGVLFAGVVVAGMCFVAAHWERVHAHSLPNIRANIAHPR